MYRAKKREIAIMYVRIAAIAVAFTLGACASTPTDPADPGAVADPYEGFNRQMFAFNNGVDKYALGPAAGVYKTVTPMVPPKTLPRVRAILRDWWLIKQATHKPIR